MRPLRNLSFLLVFSGLLAGCGATTQTVSVKDKKGAAIVVTEKTEATVASVRDDKASNKEAEVTSVEKEIKTIPVPRKPLPEITVLMGKSVAEIEQVFGRPVLQRKDAPAEVWQYLTDDCALHLVFYPGTKDVKNNLVVQHVSMNDRNQAVEVNARKCFGSQLRKVGEDRAQILS